MRDSYSLKPHPPKTIQAKLEVGKSSNDEGDSVVMRGTEFTYRIDKGSIIKLHRLQTQGHAFERQLVQHNRLTIHSVCVRHVSVGRALFRSRYTVVMRD